jgi:AraC family transcriptional regulator
MAGFPKPGLFCSGARAYIDKTSARQRGRMEAADNVISALETFTVEHRLVFTGGQVEIRRYDWERPTLDVWTGAQYVLDFPLFRRPGVSRAAYLDTEVSVGRNLRRIMFVPPGRLVRSGAGLGHHRSMLCVLDRDMIDGLLAQAPCWNETRLADGLSLNSPEIEFLLLKIYRELQESGFAVALMVERLAGAVAIALIRHFELDAAASRHSGGLATWRLKLIRERLSAELPSPGVAELAKMCGMSVRNLSRAVKTETGLTVSKLAEQAAMERARRLLAERRMGVAEVAQSLGFASASTFSSAFRRATGMRPGEVPRQAPGERSPTGQDV